MITCLVLVVIGVVALLCGWLERARTHGPWMDEPQPFDQERAEYLTDLSAVDFTDPPSIDADRASDIVADDIVREGPYR